MRLLLLALTLVLWAPPASAGVQFVVTRTDDPAPDGCLPGDCSLREAVIAANAAPGQDGIVLAAETYVLSRSGDNEDFASTGDLDIRDDLAITGAAALSTSIRGDGTDRVFDVVLPVQVDMEQLAIVDGVAFGGAGILVRGGDTYLQDCLVVNNTAVDGGGILVLAGGRVELAQTTVRNNIAQQDGGGIFDEGDDLTIYFSFVEDNQAVNGDGGGIWTAGGGSTGAEITLSRIAGNAVSGVLSGGGGIHVQGGIVTVSGSEVSENTAGFGGGVDRVGGSLQIRDSTIRGNLAFAVGGVITFDLISQGAVVMTGSTISHNAGLPAALGVDAALGMTLENCTVSNNIGARAVEVAGTGPLTLRNSTVSGDDPPVTLAVIVVDPSASALLSNSIVAGTALNCRVFGTLTSAGGNLDSDGSCNLTQPTDLPGVDPLLGPLQDNGGPTETHALLPGSPAIDAGLDAACPATDQRGEPRVDGDGDTIVTCDIGAFEFQTDDPDGDGLDTPNDNCADERNPDQLDSDGDCALPGADIQNCGDVCDPCPASADDSRCEPGTSGGASIGPEGGSFTTDDGLITVEVPPGAVDTEVSISVTENERQFFPDIVGASAPLYLVGFRPEGQHFSVPVIVTFRWPDRDNDGRIDKGVCVDGPEAGQSCDENGDCAPSTCTRTTAPNEQNLVLKRNGAKFGRFGFELPVGLTPDEYTCAAHELAAAGTNGCAVAVADCSDPAGTGEASVANCCNTAGTPLSDWMFQTCDFSTVLIGASFSDLIPGKGSPKTDCVAEWAIDNPQNDPFTDKRGRPHFKQTCVDGDALCDADGTANGECVFEAGVCLNVADERLVKRSGEAACAPTDVARWELKKPRPDSRKPAEAANAVALRDAVARLGTATVGGTHRERLTFGPPVTVPDTCTELVPLRVPLKGSEQDKKGKATVKARATTSPLLGGKGARDSDTLKLTCLPAGG